MVHSTRDRVLRLLSSATRHANDQTDAQLLQRFVRERDDNILRPDTARVRTGKDGRFRVEVPFADQEFVILLMKDGRYVDTGKRFKGQTVSPGEEKALDPVTVKTEEP